MSENPDPARGPRAPSPRRRRRVLRWAVTLLAVGGLTAYLPWLWVMRQSDGHVHRLADAPSADVTLVLGAGLTPSGRPSPYLAARLDVAKALLDAGKILQQADQTLAEQAVKLRHKEEQLTAIKRDESALRFTISALMLLCLFLTALTLWIMFR